jgi:hypothetical protein
MRRDHPTNRRLLTEVWDAWARRCRDLTSDQWATPTRCRPWDVHALAAHVVPDPAQLAQLTGSAVAAPAAVDDAAELLRRFNQPGGVAHTMAGLVAEQAVASRRALPTGEIASRFEACRGLAAANDTPGDTVLAHPVVGRVTLAVVTELALMEAVVHHLDLVAAVGGDLAPAPAVAAVRDLLIAIPDAAGAVEALTGRAPLDGVIPVLR